MNAKRLFLCAAVRCDSGSPPFSFRLPEGAVGTGLVNKSFGAKMLSGAGRRNCTEAVSAGESSTLTAMEVTVDASDMDSWTTTVLPVRNNRNSNSWAGKLLEV
jgi:hypothetical protein